MTTIASGQLVTASEINQWAPPGMVADYAGSAAPSGWLLCDGASYLRTDYPDLFTAIGTTYGAADGTHFNVPDCRGRTSTGYAASGGHVDVSTLGANDGVAAANRRPKHSHTQALTLPNHVHNQQTADGAGATLTTSSNSAGAVSNQAVRTTDNPTSLPAINGTVGATGGASDAPAYIVLNKIIRAKDV